MNQGSKNQVALTKGQVQKRCASSSTSPDLQQSFPMCVWRIYLLEHQWEEPSEETSKQKFEPLGLWICLSIPD